MTTSERVQAVKLAIESILAANERWLEVETDPTADAGLRADRRTQLARNVQAFGGQWKNVKAILEDLRL